MKRQAFREQLASEIHILDGALGTMLQPHLSAGGCIDAMNLEQPDIVAAVHKQYVAAGAHIITTNTFGATRLKLSEFGLAKKTKEINRAGAALAKKNVRGGALVAGSVGPTGKLIEPLGDVTFEQAQRAYKEQVIALAEGGVDLFLLETFSDLKEAKIACMAVREYTDLPLMVSMTFGEGYVTFTGTDPAVAATVLSSIGADAIGVNCSTGPEPMLEIVGRLVVATDLPVYVEPNAGVPRLAGDNTTEYITSPEVMADFAEKYVVLGANCVGSCCGSTPAHTAQLRERLKNKKPLRRSLTPALRLSSRYRTLAIGADLPFCVIGERINPTNRANLAEEIRSQKATLIQQEAQAQEREGAHMIDVNIGVPGVHEASVLPRALRSIETVTQLPLSIDSTDAAAVENALRETAGKVLINSVTAEEESLSKIPKLAAKYGAGLICLAVGRGGIPDTAEQRMQVLKEIVAGAEKAGVQKEQLICDCLTLTVSAQQKRAEETLRAIRMVKAELGLPTVLGISNISFGLPERHIINATFLSMAMSAGLDAAIMNPGDERVMETVRAASVLTLRDRDSRAYVSDHIKRRKKKKTAAPALRETQKEALDIYQAVLSGNKHDIKHLVEKAIVVGKTVTEINGEMLVPAIEEVGARYERKELYLPQMILAAETFQEAFKVLEPHFERAEIKSKGTIVMCTVKGDVHDIGKNIVALLLRNHGYTVVDLGKDVSAEEIYAHSQEAGAGVIGLSALMTTTMAEMPRVIELLRRRNSPSKVIVGGAVVSKKYAQDIGADAYAGDGITAVARVKALFLDDQQ